jgi:photosystem II stability/assembly factor-like uncharacterized protein
MRSNDGGLTWAVIARLGEADLHRMVLKFGRLYAFDAVLGAVLVSSDGGRTFQQHIAPPEPMVELEIDPGDAGRMLLASEQTTFRSVDGGDHWRRSPAPRGRVMPGPPRGRSSARTAAARSPSRPTAATRGGPSAGCRASPRD